MVTKEFTPAKKLKLVILVHAFVRYDMYYYRWSNTTQVVGLQAM